MRSTRWCSCDAARGPLAAGRRLLGQCRDEVRVRVAKRVHRNAGTEVEVAFTFSRDQPRPFAAVENQVPAGIGPHDCRRRAICGDRASGQRGWQGFGHGAHPTPMKSKRPPPRRPSEPLGDTRGAFRCQRRGVPAPRPCECKLRFAGWRPTNSGDTPEQSPPGGLSRISLWRRRHVSLSTGRRKVAAPCRGKSGCCRFSPSGHEISRCIATLLYPCPARVEAPVCSASPPYACVQVLRHPK